MMNINYMMINSIMGVIQLFREMFPKIKSVDTLSILTLHNCLVKLLYPTLAILTRTIDAILSYISLNIPLNEEK